MSVLRAFAVAGLTLGLAVAGTDARSAVTGECLDALRNADLEAKSIRSDIIAMTEGPEQAARIRTALMQGKDPTTVVTGGDFKTPADASGCLKARVRLEIRYNNAEGEPKAAHSLNVDAYAFFEGTQPPTGSLNVGPFYRPVSDGGEPGAVGQNTPIYLANRKGANQNAGKTFSASNVATITAGEIDEFVIWMAPLSGSAEYALALCQSKCSEVIQKHALRKTDGNAPTGAMTARGTDGSAPEPERTEIVTAAAAGASGTESSPLSPPTVADADADAGRSAQETPVEEKDQVADAGATPAQPAPSAPPATDAAPTPPPPAPDKVRDALLDAPIDVRVTLDGLPQTPLPRVRPNTDCLLQAVPPSTLRELLDLHANCLAFASDAGLTWTGVRTFLEDGVPVIEIMARPAKPPLISAIRLSPRMVDKSPQGLECALELSITPVAGAPVDKFALQDTQPAGEPLRFVTGSGDPDKLARLRETRWEGAEVELSPGPGSTCAPIRQNRRVPIRSNHVDEEGVVDLGEILLQWTTPDVHLFLTGYIGAPDQAGARGGQARHALSAADFRRATRLFLETAFREIGLSDGRAVIVHTPGEGHNDFAQREPYTPGGGAKEAKDLAGRIASEMRLRESDFNDAALDLPLRKVFGEPGATPAVIVFGRTGFAPETAACAETLRGAGPAADVAFIDAVTRDNASARAKENPAIETGPLEYDAYRCAGDPDHWLLVPENANTRTEAEALEILF
ncbi:MAG: hypothetical protein VX463_18535, partial [Pseudomonadota bacterium]|nr:hypothetical protein [Pseudomonadota bacterium]